MPNKKISQLPVITSLTGTETIPALKDSIVKKTTTGVVTNRMKDLARYSNYSAIQDIKESAKETLFEGLSAGSVLQQDITAVSGALHRSPYAVTAMFVYDTSKDSDGGAWTEKCQHTSWYNEPLSGKWLGAKADELDAVFANASVSSTELVDTLYSASEWTLYNGAFSNDGTTLIAYSSGANNVGYSYVRGTKGLSQNVDPTKRYILKFKAKVASVGQKSRINITYGGGGPKIKTSIIQSTEWTEFSTYYAPYTATGDYFVITNDIAGTTTYFKDFSLKEVTSTSTQSNDYYQSTADGKFYALSKNLLTTTNTLSTQTQWLTAGTYTVSSTTASTGSVAISGAATATHTAGGTATTFTVATSGSVTFTVTGSVTNAQCELGSAATFYKANASTLRYTEVFRGNKAEFPKLAGIVAEAGSVTIYDLTEAGRPMWMRIVAGLGIVQQGSIYCVVGLNGLFVVGGVYGLNTFDFPNDIIKYTRDTGNRRRQAIALRATSVDVYNIPEFPLLSGWTIYAAAITVLPNAPISSTTGLPIPTFAVATNSSINLYKHDGTRVISQAISANYVSLSPRVMTASTAANSTLYYYPNPANISANFTLLTESSGVDFNQGNTAALSLKTRSELSRSSGAKLQLLKNNESSVAKGAAATITPTYNTGYMVGDIKRSYLTGVAPGTITSTAYAARGLFLDGTTQGIWLDPSDLTTMYQYSTGSTPVTGVEQQVGLILDKSVGNPWVQKIKDPNLNVVSNWSNTAVFSNGRYISGNSSDTTYAPTSGKLYRYTYVVSKASTGGLAIYIAGIQKGSSSAIPAGTYTGIVVSTGGTKIAEFYDPGWGWNGEIEYFSVEELTGNYAYAPDAARPTLSARYNLLTKTENFSSYPDWITFNTSVDINNILTATSSGSIRYIYHNGGIGSVSGNYTLITKLKAGTTNWAWVVFSDRNTNSAGAYFDLQNGVVGNITQGGTAFSLIGTPTISLPDSNGYRTCMITISSVGGTLIAPSIGISDGNGSPYVTSGKTIALGGADIRPADQAGLPYQRVNTATDYDSDITKFPYYLKFSGAQYLQTNSINFSYTDKMFVCAGVRKLSDAVAAVAEHNDPTVWSWTLLSNQYELRSGSYGSYGNSGTYGNSGSLLTSPVTAVQSVSYSANGVLGSDFIAARVNGVAKTYYPEVLNAASGKLFSNYPLYIGARAGTSLFFNGQLSQLLIAGKAVTTKQIQDAENYIEQKTYGTYPEFLVDAAGNQIVDASGNPLYANVTYQY